MLKKSEEERTAKEMFEELEYGVRKGKSKNSNIEWVIIENNTEQIRIGSHGLIFFESKNYLDVFINTDTLKAINKQIEELGWLID